MKAGSVKQGREALGECSSGYNWVCALPQRGMRNALTQCAKLSKDLVWLPLPFDFGAAAARAKAGAELLAGPTLCVRCLSATVSDASHTVTIH
jgi:hypothetical protein